MIERPFIVFTNSQTDYRVTVKSNSVAVADQHLIERLSREFETTSSNAFDAAIVLPAANRSGGLWAVRSFDCGKYLGRPQTLGLVALWFPADRRGDTPIWRHLAALPAPRPGNDSYVLPQPSEQTEGVPPCLEELRRWEERGTGDIPKQPIFFGIAPARQDVGRPSPKYWRWGAGIGLIFLTILLSVIGFARWNYHSPSPQAIPVDLSQEQKTQKKDLFDCLNAAGAPVSNDLNLQTLFALALQCEPPIRERCKNLRDEIQSRGRDNTPSQLQGLIKDITNDWSDPLILRKSPDTANAYSAPRCNDLISLMSQYKMVRSQVKEIVDNDIATGKLFQLHIEELKKTLDGMVRPEVGG